MISSIMNSTSRNCNNSDNFFNLLIEIAFRIHKPNFIIVFDPLLSMIGRIFSQCWGENNYKVKRFIVFFSNELYKTGCVLPQPIWPVQIAVWGSVLYSVIFFLFDDGFCTLIVFVRGVRFVDTYHAQGWRQVEKTQKRICSCIFIWWHRKKSFNLRDNIV